MTRQRPPLRRTDDFRRSATAFVIATTLSLAAVTLLAVCIRGLITWLG